MNAESYLHEREQWNQQLLKLEEREWQRTLRSKLGEPEERIQRDMDSRVAMDAEEQVSELEEQQRETELLSR